MAFKIYKKNNYIIIEDTISGKQYQGLAKNVFVYKDAVAETTYDFEGLTYNGLKGISLNDLVDETDTAFVNEQAFIDFYTENTGNFNSGGGSPQLTANELLGIQNANELSDVNPVATQNDIIGIPQNYNIEDPLNLYNSASNVVGREITTSNIEQTQASETYTTVIGLNQPTITVSGLPSGAVFPRYYIFLNSSNVIVGSGNILAGNTTAVIEKPLTAVAFKINLTGRNASGLSNLGNVRIEYGSKITTKEEKVIKINEKSLYVEWITGTKDKKTIIFGDSITETTTLGGASKSNWPLYAAGHLQWDWTNYARSGARVKGAYKAGDRTKLATQIADAITAQGSENIDIIVFNIMTNDTDSSSYGNYATAMAKTDINTLDLTNFAEAIRYAFWKVSSQWVNAKIYACTPIRRVNGFNEANMNACINLLKQTAEYYNIKIIDQYNKSGISQQYEIVGVGRYLTDGLHPSTSGQKLQEEFISNEIIKDFIFKTTY